MMAFLPGLFLAAVPQELTLPLMMLVVFGSAKLGAELFEVLGQPGIVGEILAGVVIGPSVLGWIAPSALLSSLGDLGVMFLLFRVGLEVKSSELLKVGTAGFFVAASGVIVPFFAGWGLLIAWGATHFQGIFVGASLVATSVGITAQVLAAKGLLDQKASQVILAAAIIDDVLGLLVLAVVSSMARGSLQLLDITLSLLLASSFVLIVAVWGTHAMRRILPRTKILNLAEAEFALSICLLFALASLATYAGVAAIVGAFLAGMALGENVAPRVHLLVGGSAELLIPFFLVGLGLQVDAALFRSSSVLLLAGTVLLVAVVTKLIGCGVGALHLGVRDAIKVGVGMIPRGEVGMVVAQLGLSMGILSRQLYGVIVFMAVATTLVAPPLLKLAYSQKREIAPSLPGA